MDLICRCAIHPLFTCVACKVKRGDYRDWMEAEPTGQCVDCGAAVNRAERCRKCYEVRYYIKTLKRSA